jgi:hypothetical protein
MFVVNQDKTICIEVQCLEISLSKVGKYVPDIDNQENDTTIYVNHEKFGCYPQSRAITLFDDMLQSLSKDVRVYQMPPK